MPKQYRNRLQREREGLADQLRRQLWLADLKAAASSAPQAQPR
jgi:hypothetical protein